MPQIEILAYAPLNMDEFVDFFVNGVRDENGHYVKDDQDRLITGVIAWLHGREVPRARFFRSSANDPVQLFMSVIEPTEPESVPWMRRVPGFHERVRADGLIGLAPDFNVAMDSPLHFVRSSPELDQVFVDSKQDLDNIDFSNRSFSKEAFLQALKGETDLTRMLDELKSEAEFEAFRDRNEFNVTPSA